MINFNKVDVNGLVNTENNLKQQVEVLVSQIIEKLSTDSDLRTQLISKMSGELQRASVNDNEVFKQAIIKELSSLVKQGTDNKIESHAPVMEFETLSNIQTSEKGETETNEGSIERRNSENTEVNAKAVNKEDKLLKDLVLDDSTKSTKDSISDKIANVVTRFEAIRTDKPAVVEAQVVINRNNLNADFIKAVKFMEVNNIQELSVKVIPKDLGEIVIRLSMDNGVMKASISTSNKETYNLLNSQLTVISNQLADQNMNIQSFNLSLYNGDNFLFSGKGNDQDEKKQQGKKATKVNSVDSDEVMVQEYETESSNINALA